MSTPYQDFQQAIRDLNLMAQKDMNVLWKQHGADPGAADILAELVQTYGDSAAAMAADWYDELRADTGVRGSFQATIPEPENPGTTQLVQWAAAKATTPETLQSLISGGVQRRITNYARNVVTESAYKDTQARGWMRIGSGACGFCAMLISRGSVYTEKSVQFHSHDDCNCGAAPAWSPDQIHEIRGEFVPSARRRSDETRDADNARARAWIEHNL